MNCGESMKSMIDEDYLHVLQHDAVGFMAKCRKNSPTGKYRTATANKALRKPRAKPA